MYYTPAYVMSEYVSSPPGLAPPTHIDMEPVKVPVNPRTFDTHAPWAMPCSATHDNTDSVSTEDGSDRDTTSSGSSFNVDTQNIFGGDGLLQDRAHWRHELAANPDRGYSAIAQTGTFSKCRWHKSASTVGTISADGHVFTKTASGQKVVINDRGMPMELSSICMVFDATLRCGGVHTYKYEILSGELGAADGAGFVFDSKVRRNNIQQMRTVFLNQRGVICIRDRQTVRKLKAQLPPLEAGLCLTLTVDLDHLQLHFLVSSPEGVVGIADVSLDGLFDPTTQANFHSGFFCAVVTKQISVSLC